MRPALFRLVTATAFVALAACATEQASGPSPLAATLPVSNLAVPTLLRCEPVAAGQTVSGVIGILGGTLRIGNTSVVIPENAVPVATTFTLTVPSSPIVEI